MKVPSPGESIKEVEIATWLVKDGDYVEKDQAIAEVDSDKATLELPANGTDNSLPSSKMIIILESVKTMSTAFFDLLITEIFIPFLY